MAGQRVEKDPEKGLELMRNAALLGSRQAQFFLGAAYENGGGVPPSAEHARQYFRLCAATGETPCQVRLAQLLLQAAGDDHSGSGDRQYLQALAWLDLAAEQGDMQAQMILDGERAGLLSATGFLGEQTQGAVRPQAVMGQAVAVQRPAFA